MKTLLLLFIFFITLPSHSAPNRGDKNTYAKGGIIRTDQSKKQLTLVFTCADMADGAESILNTLRQHKIRAAFFLTGNFIKKYPSHVKRMVKEKHYIGSHSFSHPLYSSWEKPDSTTISKEDFKEDIKLSYDALSKYGINTKKAPYFMPPYEHYNDTISKWAAEMGLQIVNFTPGSTSNADYTTPAMRNYRSSEEIFQNILSLEEKEGLNGHIMLFHIGTVNARIDKFYNGYLEKLILELKARGYKFTPLKKAIKNS